MFSIFTEFLAWDQVSYVCYSGWLVCFLWSSMMFVFVFSVGTACVFSVCVGVAEVCIICVCNVCVCNVCVCSV